MSAEGSVPEPPPVHILVVVDTKRTEGWEVVQEIILPVVK